MSSRRLGRHFRSAIIGPLTDPRGHGGDFGSIISPELGRIAPEQVIGVHVNDSPAG